MVSVLTAFIYLQILDALTTVAFMMHGLNEVNPVIKWAMREASNPLGGLFLVKAVSILVAAVCVSYSRYGVLRKVNFFFAFVVAYNLVALILAAPVLR